LAGLASGTLYHYRVQSRDIAGNLAVSQDYSFTTLLSYATTLFYPRMLTTGSAQQDPQNPEFIGFGIANLDSQPATLRFTAYNSAGAPLSGTGITNPVTRVLQPGAQLPIANSDYDLFGAGSAGTDSNGWVKIESTVSSVAGFFMMYDGQLTELDGTDMADTPITSFVFSQIKNNGFNRINIGNPNADPTTLTFSLTGADGTLQASASRDIPAYGALVADLANDIFPGFAPDTTQYVKVTSTRNVLPLELLGKPSRDIESLHGQDATLGGTTLYCPQYVVGGMWRSALSIVSLDSVPAGISLRFIGDDASQIGTTRVLQIAPYGKILIDDPAFFQQPADPQAVSSGYVEITSNSLFAGGIRMTGSVAFGDGAGNLETALPLTTSLDQSIVFSHVSSNNQYFTGVAIVNPNYADAHLTVALYNEDGTLALTTNLTIPARQRISELLTQIFPALAGQQRFSGYFRVTSDVGVASFAAFGTNSLSLISAIPAQIVR
jgi:hypothetical protein